MFCFRQLFQSKRLIKPLLFGLGLGLFETKAKKADCCGIIGVLTSNNNAQVVVTEGIKLLQNRGYDSAGIVTFRQTTEVETHLTKYAVEEEKNCIQKVCQEGLQNHKGSFMGIGHTRWATCGSKTSHNAHPHFDQSHKYYLVHNGTIVNYKELRQTYLSDRVFTSQTDTEVIVQLLAKECEQNQLTVEQGLRKIQDLMIGQWGLVVMNKDHPDEIYVSTYGSPILIGFSEEATFVASQSIAFEKYTKDYIETKNEEVYTISLKNKKLLKEEMEKRGRLLKVASGSKVKLTPDPPFESFYEQEIHEQGQLKFKPYLHQIEDVIFQYNLTILGCGSSFYASMYSLYYFKILKAFKKIHVLDAAELIPEDIQQDDSIIFVSQSGETKDLLSALEKAKKVEGVKTIGVINVVGSALARNVDYPIYTNVGRQTSVGATKSFSHQILNLLAIAMKIAEKKGHSSSQIYKNLQNDLRHIQDHFKLTIEKVKQSCKIVAYALKNKQSLYLLAKGETLAIAKEGSLKIKELCYIHAQAFGASEMKHGPLALINCDMPKETSIILLVLDDGNLPAMRVAIDEMHSRKAHITVITNCLNKLNKSKIDLWVEVPHLMQLSSLMCLIPLQLIANDISVCLAIDLDKPRNLAKTVTV